MDWQDIMNGTYEFFGGFLILLHCKTLWKDKTTKGVSITAFAFFATWGIWNLYYYPHLGQYVSLIGSCNIMLWNLVWVFFALHYRKKTHKARSQANRRRTFLRE